ncbi:MAG: peroxiredoxin family protein [Sporichthyaceae bacterium]
MPTSPLAPELEVSEWLNGPEQSLADLRGRVLLIKTFQMLCPGCVDYGLPQAQRVHQGFERAGVTVLGLHTVFEHHEVMGPAALAVFLTEYKYTFPVGIDRHDGGTQPLTMKRYGLQGTPSTVLVDREGRLRHTSFGAVDDLVLGALLGQLIAESASAPLQGPEHAEGASMCAPGTACS